MEANIEVSSHDTSKVTCNMEKAFASISFALLKQREALESDMRNFLSWAQSVNSLNFADIRTKLNEVFSDGEYNKITADTLQLVCGHRAELIQHRREDILSAVKDPAHKVLFRKIPPSCSNLFESEKFSSVLEKAGGMKVFWSKGKDRISAPQNDPRSSSQSLPKKAVNFNSQQHQSLRFQPRRQINSTTFRDKRSKPIQARQAQARKRPRNNSPSSHRDRRDQFKRQF